MSGSRLLQNGTFVEAATATMSFSISELVRRLQFLRAWDFVCEGPEGLEV